jgi:hypothetical protein
VASIERGHWSFQNRAFTPITGTDVCNLFQTTAEIDLDIDCINAVRVMTQRSETPVPAFFGAILGLKDYLVRANAVAYVGYAGSLPPHDLDQPITICKEALNTDSMNGMCSIGRFIPSSHDTFGETGGYTDFNQERACHGGTNAPAVSDLVCKEGNPLSLTFGEDMATLGGQVQSVFDEIEDCWKQSALPLNGSGQPTTRWNMTLPVVSCTDANVGPCNELAGAINVDVVWIVGNTDKIDDDAPRKMDEWPTSEDPDCSTSGDPGPCRWDSFVTHFNILNPDGELALYSKNPKLNGWRKKTIYFLPDCKPHEPIGRTEGENFGVLARIPVLVD